MDKVKESLSPEGTAAKQLTVFLPNRVGALKEIVQIVNKEHVEVLGFNVMDAIDATVVRMLTSDIEHTQLIFDKRAIPYSSSEVLLVEMTEGAAGLGKCLSGLLVAEINIHFTYPLLCRPNGRAVIVIHTDDLDFTGHVLHTHGFSILCQEDLSR